MADTPEKRELDLVDKVDFRILEVANNERKLEALLSRYLAPVILKAGSEHASVRNKVIAILKRVNTFVQPPGVVLPVGALIDQFKSNSSPVVKQFDLVFIHHSLPRMDIDDKRDLFKKVTKDISHGDPGAQSAGDSGLFDVFLRLLTIADIPPRGTKPDLALRETLGMSDSDGEFLSRWLGKILLLKPAGSNATAQTLRDANADAGFSPVALDFLVPIHKQVSPALLALPDLKVRAANFLSSGAFKDIERFIPALHAASATDSRVSEVGTELLKRTTVDLEDPVLVRSLFEAHSRLGPRYRTRILGLLCKSSVSTTMTKEIYDATTRDFAPVQEETTQNAPATNRRQGSLERTKLHTALFQYLRFAATVGPTKGDFDVAFKLTERMRGYIQDQGWPVAERTSGDDVALRSLAYELVGILGKVSKVNVQQRTELMAWIFRSAAEDPSTEVVVNIDGALSSLMGMFPRPNDDEPSFTFLPIRSLLLAHMVAEIQLPRVRSTRLAAVKWANNILPFSSIHGRWIDILAVGGRPDERSDVVEEGQKGLDPWSYYAHSDAKNIPLPDWQEMLTNYFEKSALENRPVTDDAVMTLQGAVNYWGERARALPVALGYCKQMMFLAAVKDFPMAPDWSRNLHNLIKTDLKTRAQIREYLAGLPDPDGHNMFFLKTSIDGMLFGNESIVEDCARCLVEVAALSPRSAIAYLADLPLQLMPAVKSNKKEVRVLAAEAFGILAAHPANSDAKVSRFAAALEEVIGDCENKVGAELNAAEGAILAFAHLCSRCVFYGRSPPAGVTYPLGLLVKERIPPSLQETLLDAFGQLWAAGLGVSGTEQGGDVSVKTCTEALLALAKKGNEKAIASLGKLAISIGDDEDHEDWGEGSVGAILKGLFELHEIKQAEVHFTIGEAIASTVARWDADCVKLGLNVDATSGKFQKPKRAALITAVLNKLFEDCKGTKPSLLKASGIWLFCIVQYCSHLDEVKSRLREMQAAFMRLLHTRDELTQETASRGLSLVYEKGDESIRGQLTSDLVSAFTGTGQRLKVDEDTELFDAGALPTGDGKSVTSYKDIVSLASEVGDQTLVYKFMSLASNAAMWTTRSAFGRFGLSSILSESEVDPKIYPKLYRYRFDPNPNVQRSMEDIWKSLVKDPNAVIETHFDAIMEDLLKSALGREWRMREASCGAIADLVHGRPFPRYEKYYTEMWAVALKLMDDMKGSVRSAALKLCVGLSNSLLRLLEESSVGGSVQAMLKEVIPFLLSGQGIDNSVEDVRLFATLTLINIAKKGGRNLRPFVPEMIPQLLGLLSTIEPEQIGFYYQRVGEGGRELIDRRRAAMVTQSPISEAIENCLRFADADTLAAFAPNLEATIKSAVGMPTKIGCGRVLITLFSAHVADVRGLAARFLQLMERHTLDANDEVSKSYARATAYIVRAAPDAAKERFCTRFTDLYFNAEDEVRRRKVADVVVALSETSPDQFAALGATLLPFAYFGSHDVDEYTRTAFSRAWGSHAGTARSVAWHVKEIVAHVSRGLDAPRWGLQHTAAFAVSAAAVALAESSDERGQISEANLRVLWPAFERALALKTFAGKEKLLEALPRFVEKGEALWRGDEKISALQKKIVVREAKRNSEAYRVHAYVCLWKFAKARPDLDFLGEIIGVVEPSLEEFGDEAKDDAGADKMDVDSKEDHGAKLAGRALEAVARGYNRPEMAAEPAAQLGVILKTLSPYLGSPAFQQIRREVWYSAVTDLLDDAGKSFGETADAGAGAGAEGLLAGFLDTLSPEVVEVGTEAQRVGRAGALGALVRAWKRGVFGGAGVEGLKERVEGLVGGERSEVVKGALKKVLVELR
ncbi:related to ECM29 protein [Cephalotrichum gorgonifer]|uniref:Related to ECM29 protein n=1 Tax=Cephalotrichum gorgonifer TaxID=2041049 RepID=A0AAE8MNI4_9PEZI|nr:related to ECM29 protein [Cephalotrichum gorgonifer]